ncbi:MAG: hypothetical protein GXN93_03955 [Candidatus Diapherotrites archaeon]|nr:hypothetical protein [Candidatus Diapherotrites archaeon]
MPAKVEPPFTVLDPQTGILYLNPRVVPIRAVYGVIGKFSTDYYFAVDGSADGIVRLHVRSRGDKKVTDEVLWQIYTDILTGSAVELRADEARSLISSLVSPGPTEHMSSVR